jgi:hypothetical protein
MDKMRGSKVKGNVKNLSIFRDDSELWKIKKDGTEYNVFYEYY